MAIFKLLYIWYGTWFVDWQSDHAHLLATQSCLFASPWRKFTLSSPSGVILSAPATKTSWWSVCSTVKGVDACECRKTQTQVREEWMKAVIWFLCGSHHTCAVLQVCMWTCLTYSSGFLQVHNMHFINWFKGHVYWLFPLNAFEIYYQNTTNVSTCKPHWWALLCADRTCAIYNFMSKVIN